MRYTIFLFTIMISLCYSQTLLWQRSFNNDISPYRWDIGYKVFESDDGSLLTIGTTEWAEWDSIFLTAVHYPVFIIKTDEDGLLISKNMYGDSAGVWGAYKTAEDTIVVFSPLYIIWLNQNGDSIFANPISRLSYPYEPFGGATTITNDNHLILVTSPLPDSGSAISLCTMSLTGELLSTRDYYPFGDTFDDNVIPACVLQTRDRGFIIGGNTLMFFSAWIMKLDSTGDVEWISYPYYSSGISSILETAPNEFLCLGSSGYTKIFLCKITGDGDIDWQRYWNFDDTDTSYVGAWGLIPTYDRNFVFCGCTGDHVTEHGIQDAYIMKIDSLGNVIWQRRVDFYGRPDVFYSVIQTQDSGYVCTGYASTSSGSLDVCLAKFSKDGASVWENTVKIPQSITISISPNPFNSSCEIVIDGVGAGLAPAQIEIYDLRGNLVYADGVGVSFMKPHNENGFDESNPYIWTPDKSIPSGIYLIKATMKDGQRITKRIVYVR